VKVFLRVFSPSAAAGCEPSRSRGVEGFGLPGLRMQCSAAWLQVQGSPAVGTAGTLGGCLSGFREVEVSESAGPPPPCLFFGV